jgi:TIR domain
VPRIFVSYRRRESSGHAGRLFDRLRQHFGDGVFRDVDKLKPGEDFVEALARALDSAQVFILVIGHEWVDTRDDKGNRLCSAKKGRAQFAAYDRRKPVSCSRKLKMNCNALTAPKLSDVFERMS